MRNLVEKQLLISALIHSCFNHVHSIRKPQIEGDGILYVFHTTIALSSTYPVGNDRMTLCCRCVSPDGTFQAIDPDGQVAFLYNCTEAYAASYTILVCNYVPDIHKFGSYVCQKNQERAESFRHLYSFCSPTSPKCRQSCSDNSKKLFCVVNKDHPDGEACVVPQDCTNSYYESTKFCPGNRASFCDAANNDLSKIDFSMLPDGCPKNGEGVFVFVNGQRLHLLESVVVTRSSAEYVLLCSPWSMKQWTNTLVIISWNMDNETNTIRKKRCGFSEKLADDIFSLLPQRIVVFGHAGDEDQQLVRHQATVLNYLVVFKEQITFRYNHNSSDDEVVVEIVSESEDPHFEIDIEATLDGEKLQTNNSMIPVSRSGTLKIKLKQSYFSCVPHTHIVGPDLEQTIEITVPTTAAQTEPKTTVATTKEIRRTSGQRMPKPKQSGRITHFIAILAIFLLLPLLLLVVFVVRSRRRRKSPSKQMPKPDLITVAKKPARACTIKTRRLEPAVRKEKIEKRHAGKDGRLQPRDLLKQGGTDRALHPAAPRRR